MNARVAAVVATTLILAACGSSGAPSAALSTTTSTPSSSTTSTEEQLTTTDSAPAVLAFTQDDLDDGSTPAATDSGAGGSGTGSSGSSGSGSGNAGTASPATGGGGNGIAGYSGLLGTLGIDDILYGAPAPAPIAAPGTAPLTGLAGSVPNRPAVMVKIDNSSKARPQVGLSAADIIFEEQVEGGITRLAAVFHSKMSTVGPVRSGRTTDISFMNAFGGAAFVYSGANKIIDGLLLNQTTVHNYSAARTGGFWRDGSRRAPSNLFTDTSKFTSIGSSPPAQFAYGTPPAGAPAGSVSISYPGVSVGWTWDGSRWLRRQSGSAHISDGAQLGAANVVVVVVPGVPTGMVDSAGFTVPEYLFVGEGAVSIFTNGQRIEGTWTRPTLRSPAILVDANQDVIELNPGVTWVELVESGTYSSS